LRLFQSPPRDYNRAITCAVAIRPAGLFRASSLIRSEAGRRTTCRGSIRQEAPTINIPDCYGGVNSCSSLKKWRMIKHHQDREQIKEVKDFSEGGPRVSFRMTDQVERLGNFPPSYQPILERCFPISGSKPVIITAAERVPADSRRRSGLCEGARRGRPSLRGWRAEDGSVAWAYRQRGDVGTVIYGTRSRVLPNAIMTLY